ncbi:MAG: ATP-binding cassette domain-containing protein [Clostridia bacterium]|nr:ATP-binding cassette domain-containing protein [Clostridia bacterium]
MLQLTDIVKTYQTGDTSVQALRGISIAFRRNEFVSILGPSGCGKTTLLNIVGGLDRYDSGDLSVSGRSTKEFRDADWDSYRNHSVGFVFQNYNLIPHQNALSNVELALTLSGVSKAERRKRAKQALERVGLGDQLSKKPNQMSGGQMQRVAIARALVNDPEILLADEPTGALDSETSVQIMEILEEIARDRLVIMVTHNPELADRYSTRIVRLLDGRVTDDTAPYTGEEEAVGDAPAQPTKQAKRAQKKEEKKRRKKERTSMSFWTALSLSTNNLMTKKGRTFMTSFAGSIGIIGIALIMSLSNGFQLYIDAVQQDALSAYPMSIEKETVDLTSMLESMAKAGKKAEHERDKVYSNPVMTGMMSAFSADVTTNDLASFKKFIEDPANGVLEHLSTPPQYGYNTQLNVYKADTANGVVQLSPENVLTDLMGDYGMGVDSDSPMSSMMSMSSMGNMTLWTEMLDNPQMLSQQYEVVAGKWASAYDEVVLVLDKNNEITDMALYALGLLDQEELLDILSTLMNGGEYESKVQTFSYEEILNTQFSLVLPADYYQKNAQTGQWEDMRYEDEYMTELVRDGVWLKITGIVRPDEEATATSITGAIGYTHALTEYLIAQTGTREIVREQTADPDTDIFTGLTFKDVEEKEALAARTKKKEEETTTAAPVGTGPLQPTVGTLRAQGSAVVRPISTAMTEEEIMAYIEANVPEEDREQTQEFVRVFLKTAPTLRERKQMTDAIDKWLENAPEEFAGKVTAEQAYSFTRLMTREQKLGMLTAMITGDTAALEEALPAELRAQMQSGETTTEQADEPDESETAVGTETTKAPEQQPEEAETQPSADEPQTEPAKPEEPKKEAAKNLSVNKRLLGIADPDDPDRINLYPIDFAAKAELSAIIDQYNQSMRDAGREDGVIDYTDYIGIFLSSVTTIINVVSYVLIAFVAISLVVSSIMIGIITYISVLERTKEIGILRSIGASKRDISRVFNAETLIVGLAAGVIGIIATLLLNIPVNLLIKALVDISNVSRLPFAGAAALIVISVLLTMFAGLIPSRYAAKRDPVEALRTE